jgi:hypothetical protein
VPPGSFPYVGQSVAPESCAHTVGHTNTTEQRTPSKPSIVRRRVPSLMASHFRRTVIRKTKFSRSRRCLLSGRQSGNNPESHKLSSQVLLNAVLVKVESTEKQMSGFPTFPGVSTLLQSQSTRMWVQHLPTCKESNHLIKNRASQ